MGSEEDNSPIAKETLLIAKKNVSIGNAFGWQ